MKYLRPVSMAELRKILSNESPGNYTFHAGGTDLMPRYENGMILPKTTIDLKALPNFGEINYSDGWVEIGALTTIEAIRQNTMIREKFPAISQACTDFAGTQIRHRATIGGNICNASPAGDLLPGLYLYDAEVKLISASRSRLIPIQDFIIGPGRTSLEDNELLSLVRFRNNFDHSKFYKLGLRNSMAISVVNFAIGWMISSDKLTFLDIMAGAVSPTVVRLKNCCKSIIAGEDQDQIMTNIEKDISPIDDIRASAGYRIRVLKKLIWQEIQIFKR